MPYNRQYFNKKDCLPESWLIWAGGLGGDVLREISIFSSVEKNVLCNFPREHNEEHFCEIILNLGHWFRRSCCSTEYSSFSSVPASLVHVVGIMGNITVKLFFKSGPVVEERRFHFKDFSASVANLFRGVELFVQFW